MKFQFKQRVNKQQKSISNAAQPIKESSPLMNRGGVFLLYVCITFPQFRFTIVCCKSNERIIFRDLQFDSACIL